MRRASLAAAKVELASMVRDYWAIYARTGDPSDAIKAREVEEQAKALLAAAKNSPARKFRLAPKRKPKRKFLKRINPGASIIDQLRGGV